MDKKAHSRSVPVYRSPDVIRRIKATSLLWERHLKRMDNKEMPKRVIYYWYSALGPVWA